MAAMVALTSRKAVLWTVVSAVWLLFVLLKIEKIWSSGEHISPFRYGIVIFYSAVFAFWFTNVCRCIWNGWGR